MPGREIAVETCSLLNIYLDYKGSNGSFDFQPARGDNISLAFDFKMDLPAFQELRQIADRVRPLRTTEFALLIWTTKWIAGTHKNFAQ